MNQQATKTITLNDVEIKYPLWVNKNNKEEAIQLNNHLYRITEYKNYLYWVNSIEVNETFEPVMQWQPEEGKVYGFFDDGHRYVTIGECNAIFKNFNAPFYMDERESFYHIIDIAGLDCTQPIHKLKEQCGGRWL